VISPTRWRLRLSVLRRCSVRNCAFPHLEPLKVRGCGQRPSPLPLSSRHAGEDLLSALQLRVPAGSVEEIERHLDRGRDTNPFEGRWPSTSTSSTATSSRSPLPIRKAVAASTERAFGMPMRRSFDIRNQDFVHVERGFCPFLLVWTGRYSSR
jgi:hypothetical protein